MRKFLPLLLILLIAFSSILMVACEPKNQDKIDEIVPKDWEEYAFEYAEFLANRVADIDKDMEISYKYKFIAQGYTERALTGYLRGNVLTNGGDGAVQIFADDEELFYAYHDNRDLYVENKNNKVVYENMPINDVLLKIISMYDHDRLREVYYDMIQEIVRDVFYDGYADKNKSTYTFFFDFHRNIEGIRQLIELVPGVIVDALLQDFGVDSRDVLYETLSKVRGEMKANIVEGRVSDIVVTSRRDNVDIERMFKIEEMALENKHADISAKKPIEGNHIKKKLGNFDYEGTIALNVGDKSVARYNVMLHANIDTLELIKNDYDMDSLSEDNYLHIRISQRYMDEKNKAYIDAKYLQPNGAVFEMAFSPKDFGTHMLYVVLSPKMLLNKDAIDVLDSEILTDLLMKVMPDYRLFTIDTGVLISRQMERYSDNPDIYLGLIYSLTSLVDSKIQDKDIETSVSYMDILGILNFEPRYIEMIRAMFGDGKNYADHIVFDIHKAEIRDYDIANMTLFIIDKNVGETKNYTSFSDSTADPALSWEYDDYDLDGDKKVNNIYTKDGTIIYAKDTPISKEELPLLIGASLQYSYTNYEGTAKKDNRTEILEVLDVEDGVAGYSRVTLKVRYPSRWSGFVNDYVDKYINKYIYDVVVVNVRFDEITDRAVTLAHKDTYYYGENIPQDILTGDATITYTSGSKKMRVEGKCDKLGDFLTTGSYNVVFDIASEELILPLTVRAATDNISADTTITFREVENKISLENGVWHIRINYGDRLLNQSVFDKIFVNVHHTLDYTSTRRIAKQYYYYEHNGIAHYLDSDLRNIWWLDDSGNIVFERAGSYTLKTTAGGLLAEPIEVVIDVVKNDNLDKSTYRINDNTNYRDHYFTTSTYDFNFSVNNAYHGSKGIDNVPINIKIYRGYTNSNGNLGYEMIDNIEDYIESVNIIVTGVAVRDNGMFGIIDLPASIRTPIELEMRLVFKQAGYYKLEIKLEGYKRKSGEIHVESFIHA